MLTQSMVWMHLSVDSAPNKLGISVGGPVMRIMEVTWYMARPCGISQWSNSVLCLIDMVGMTFCELREVVRSLSNYAIGTHRLGTCQCSNLHSKSPIIHWQWWCSYQSCFSSVKHQWSVPNPPPNYMTCKHISPGGIITCALLGSKNIVKIDLAVKSGMSIPNRVQIMMIYFYTNWRSAADWLQD